MPAMTREAVRSQADAMARIVDDFLDTWHPRGQIDLYASMKELALIIAGKLLFGLEEIPNSRAVTELFQDWLDSHIACAFEMVLPAKAPPGSYERVLRTAEELETQFRQLIEMRRARLRPGDNDLLALLLRAHEAGRISEIEVIGEIHTMLNASYQTTASALTWTLLLLLQHADVLHALYRQVRNGRLEHREGSLLDGVIRESLRLLPPVVFNIRMATRPTKLVGQDLPEGSYVLVSYYVTHHLPDLYPEPQRFRPERWQACRLSPYAYMPFSAGPRMCMGAAFSMQLFQIVIPAIVRRYRLALQPGTRVDRHSNLTLGVRGSLPVTVWPQDGQFTAVPLTGDIHEMVTLPPSAPQRLAA
jgi:cytochrome P450